MAGTNEMILDASGRITLVPNQMVKLVDAAGTNQLAIDSSGRITTIASGTFNDASVGTDGAAIPTSSTLIGASDGTNLQQLLVESSSRSNLRTAIYNGANELAVDAGGRLTEVIQAVAGTALAADQTNSILRISNYGKSSTAGDTAIKLNSAGSQYIVGDFTELASLTAGSLNADLVASTDVSAYKWLSLHITNAFVGTLTFQCSNDNTNFISVYLYRVDVPGFNNGGAATPSTNVMFAGPVQFRYFRVRMTAYTSGTANGVAELYANPSTPTPSNISAVQSGVWSTNLIPVTSGGCLDFHLISAASTNASTIKASAGQVYGWSIYNANAAARYVKLYNKASNPTVGTDVPVRTIGIPPSTSTHMHFTNGLTFATGIALSTNTGIADADSGAVGASDLAIEIDYK